MSALSFIKLYVKRIVRVSTGQVKVPAAAVIPSVRGYLDIDVVKKFVAKIEFD